MAKNKNGSAPADRPTLEGELVPAPIVEPLTMAEDEEAEGSDGDEGDDEDEDGETFYYCVKPKNGGLPTFHEDDRDPDEIAFDFKVALTFPLRPDSLFEEEELADFEKLQKEDPRRFGEKGARVFLFKIGDAILDPREVFMVCPADDLVYQPDDDAEDEGGGDQPTAPTTPPAAPAAPVPPPAPAPGGRLARLRSKAGASA